MNDQPTYVCEKCEYRTHTVYDAACHTSVDPDHLMHGMKNPPEPLSGMTLPRRKV